MIIDSPIISSSQFISGSSTQIGDAVISGSLTVTGTINAAITGSITSASYANFAETSVSSSYALTASYAANVPLTASNANTASYAFFAVTASYASNVPLTASNADTASYAFFAVTASYAANVPLTASNANTASYAFSAVSASYASNAELLDNRDSTTFAGTGSNTFTGSQYISNPDNATNFVSTAALYTDGGLRVTKDAYVSGTIYVNNLTVYGTSSIQYTTSSQVDIGANIITVNTNTPSIRFGGYAVFDSGSTGTGLTGSLLWDSDLNRWIYSNPSGSVYDGGIIVAGPKNTSGLGNEQSLGANYVTKGQGGDHITSSQIIDDGTTVSIPGNLTVTGSIKGTATSASFAISSSLAQTASFVTTAQTASYVLQAVSSSFAVSSSRSVTSSFAISGSSSVSSSFASTASSVNTLNQAVAISGSLGVAGTTGTTVFSSNADTLIFSGSSQFTGSFGITGSLSVTQGITGSLLGTAATASYFITSSVTNATNAISASYAATASYFVTSSVTNATSASFAQTASYVETAQTASYVLQAVSSSYALTASYISGSGGGVGFPFSGSAVITGSLLITSLSSSGVTYVTADANGLLVAQTASAAITSTQTTYASAGQTVYPISGGYTTGLVNVFVNGTKLNSTEYTDTSGTDIVLATGSFANDVVEFQKYFPASGVTNNALRQVNYFTATEGQTIFSASYTPGLLDVFYNGSKLDNTEYTANSGNAITLATASAAGDKIEIDVYSYQVGSFSGIGGSASGSQLAYFNTANSITGSANFVVSASAIVITGSLLVSGSGTFTNIGPAVFSGSLTSTQGFTGSFSGVATTASFAQTASSIANLNQNVQVTGSMTVSSTITAQTLNVQQVTSSIVYSSGSNVFGNNLSNTQQMTGSLSVTGSTTLTGALSGTTADFQTTIGSRYLQIRDAGSSTPSLRSVNDTIAQLRAIAIEAYTISLRTGASSGLTTTEALAISATGAATFSSSISATSATFSDLVTTTSVYRIVQASASRGGLYTYNQVAGSGTDYSLGIASEGEAFITTGGTATKRLVVTSGGNVGIGLTNPTDSDGYGGKVLDVNGPGYFRDNADNTKYVSIGSASSIGFIEANGTGNYLRFYTAGTEKMRISNAGDVYIGGTTSLASGALIVGDNSSTRPIVVRGLNGVDATYTIGIAFYPWNTSESNAILNTVSSAASQSGIRFDVSNGGGTTGRTASFYINRTSCTVVGSLSKGSGSFKIKHPLASKKNTHYLVHSFIEGPQADLIYRGKVRLVAGRATVNIDEAATMTEGTFEALCREVQCFTSNETSWDNVRGKVIGNILTIECQNPESTDEISWLVIGERQDEHMMDTEWTDENGKVIVEPLIPEENK